ncbi:hypothetical protein OAN13_07260 [Opitutales bacterium]|jgi:hypothetical protein|nr:hypothetical protein [Opitutales bacterium]
MKESLKPTHKEEKEEFLAFSEAANLLGSGNHTRITKLVKQGILPAYSLPLTTKLRVKRSDVFKIAEPSH